MKVTPFEAYQKYVAMKLHFTSDDYDYFLNKGRVRTSRKTFENRRDKYFFQKAANRFQVEDYENFLVANFLNRGDVWVGEILTDEGKDIYLNWKKVYASLEYSFKNDMMNLKDSDIGSNFNEMFKSSEGQHPPILVYAMRSEMSLESFVIMNKILDFFPRFDKIISETIVWPQFRRKCIKYSPFLKVDVKLYRNIMRQIYLSNVSKTT